MLLNEVHKSRRAQATTASTVAPNSDDLPKISLPKFTGSYKEWPSFRDLYLSLIHKKDIALIKKFHHLRSCLSSGAAQLIAVPVTEQNYESAWTLLCERYDKPRFIIESQVKTFIKIQAISKSSIRASLDEIQKSVRALKTLDHDANAKDTLLIQLLLSKTDRQLKEDWQTASIDIKLPTLAEFLAFLERKSSILEAIQAENQVEKVIPTSKPPQRKVNFLQTQVPICSICKQAHRIFECSRFLNKTIRDRINTARDNRLCLNCLRRGHVTNQCLSSNCQKCDKKHNTLLHLEINEGNEPTRVAATVAIAEAAPENAEPYVANLSCLHSADNSVILLSTAVIELKTATNQWVRAKAILDTGSQINFITNSLVTKLGLPSKETHMSILSLNNATNSVTKYITAKFRSIHSSFEEELDFLTIPKITGKTPAHILDKSQISVPHNIKLADPTFHRPSEIDILIGAEVFYGLLCTGQIKNDNGQHFQKTKLGWIVAGRCTGKANTTVNQVCNLATKGDNLEQLIPRFWELENVNEKTHLNREDRHCEDNFERTVQRTESGRVMVTLPFKEKPMLGDSKSMALKRFNNLEKQLERNDNLKTQYHAFMKEYIELDHMKEVSDVDNLTNSTFYLPHHGVINNQSITTKLRVVFDGSAKSSNGKSLNDFLSAGPKLQDDLIYILLRFRMHKYVLTADISKMFRQIQLHPTGKPLHRILWRFTKEEPIKSYELQTVTYGTTCASYLAIKSMQYLARSYASEFPTGANTILQSFYVDDMLTGANTIEELEQIREETIAILEKGGIKLHKWASNCPSLLQNQHNDTTIIELSKEVMHKTLGIQWSPGKDTFQYCIPEYEHTKRITKRTIMSYICSIFDPLDCLAPVVIWAKIVIQKLWQQQLGWDESLPSDLHSSWLNYRSGLKCLNSLTIPRAVLLNDEMTEVEFHGFCDASESAYGACIYVVERTHSNLVRANLLCAKSRVAPLKTQSIPRLELCGAALLAELMAKVKHHMPINFTNHYYWTDSTIVIHWLRSSSSSYKTFVANRIGQIQTLSDATQWRHVPTQENPADMISRGIPAAELLDNKLWWYGPEWLCEEEENWPILKLADPETLPERKATTCLITTQRDFGIFDRYSNLTKLVRVIAYCRRVLTPRKNKIFVNKHISGEEYNLSLICLIKLAQQELFTEEIKQLVKGHPVAKGSNLAGLHPFLDESGLIRVGGRIRNADISYHQKHQIILPHNHRLTMLIIWHEHEKSLHPGAQTTLHHVRDRYWPTKARTLTKNIVHNCIKCKRNTPKFPTHLLGDLPKARLQPCRPFLNCGVDYCGPFLLKATPRSKVITKAYLSLFVCFVTKAIHIELVTNLTSECFINALRRFMARHGRVKNISSDNATTFVGANKELKEVYEFVKDNNQELMQSFADENIQWHFIPARSPHFGGLWEAAIKSLKSHLKRSSGTKQYTYEELLTLATQVEGILNSRPLSPMSDDPRDLSVLTPGHFLIGAPINAIAEYDVQDENPNRLSRWQQVQQQGQHIWNRWRKDYLNELQQRTKWKRTTSANLKIGDLVIIKDDNLPVMRWPLGRVLEVHPGRDGVVRTVTIKTKGDVTTRSVTKLCKLPNEEQS